VISNADLETVGVAEVQEAMASGELTSADLVAGYLERIERLDRGRPAINSVRMVAPDAVGQGAARDDERRAGTVRGPLHGVPVLLKDNIDVAGWPTTGGSLALEHSVPVRDATLVTSLRDAGAVILGKTNLTEFANWMADDMPSGYSSLGGQVLNPYDVSVTPCGSSSGSGAAAALGLATVAVGSETDGSILCPCDVQSLVGVKPTVGLVSRSGMLPISASQDTAGPMTRTVYDAAALLAALAAADPDDPSSAERPADTDYLAALSTTACSGARLAVPARPDDFDAADAELFDAALTVLRERGAELVDVPALPQSDESDVLRYEFHRDVDTYFASLPDDAPVRSLAELVAWNEAHADGALKFGQARLTSSLDKDLDKERQVYLAGRRRDAELAGRLGIDSVLASYGAAALVVPSWRGAGLGARAGYPSVIVPAGYRSTNRRPFGITFLGTAWSEASLLAFAYDYEQATRLRRPPSHVNPSLFR
jgi:amidase